MLECDFPAIDLGVTLVRWSCDQEDCGRILSWYATDRLRCDVDILAVGVGIEDTLPDAILIVGASDCGVAFVIPEPVARMRYVERRTLNR